VTAAEAVARGDLVPLPWIYDDGGRAEAGRRGRAEDCVCRAIAIATGRPYHEVYDWLNELGKAERSRTRKGKPVRRSAARTGVHKPTVRKAMAELGWLWTPTMGIGTGCRVHLAVGELPGEPVITQVSGHVCAVIGGVIRDTYDPGREGTRCVYGFWYEPGDFD
jgi:hypothetical protein